MTCGSCMNVEMDYRIDFALRFLPCARANQTQQEQQQHRKLLRPHMSVEVVCVCVCV
jgi:hypothetical protein